MFCRRSPAFLSRCVRGNDTVCRLGSDEFLIVVENLFESGDSDIVAERISSSLRRQLKVGEHTISVTGSIGISTFPFDGLDPETLMKKAHLALYSSKDKGRGVYQFYSPSMNTKNQERMAIENRLREAVDKDELLLQYQPLVELETGKIAGLEALCRWQSAEMGLVSPGTFIPIAERSGLIIPIGEWVVRTACLQNKKWQQEGLPAVPVAVNISARQLQQSDFVEMIELILDDTDLESHLLELELTESATMQNLERSKRILGQLVDLGVRIVIDDFRYRLLVADAAEASPHARGQGGSLVCREHRRRSQGPCSGHGHHRHGPEPGCGGRRRRGRDEGAAGDPVGDRMGAARYLPL